MNKGKLIENFLVSDINIIKTNSILSKVPILINILEKLAIKQSKSVFFYSLEFSSFYYYAKLLAYLTKIDLDIIRKYIYPWCFKSNFEKIASDKFIQAIETIQESKLYMFSNKIIKNEDYVDYILDGEVFAWIEGKNNHTLYVASNGITKLPVDSSLLFAVFTKQYFNYNLSEVIDMSKMFTGLKHLEKINLEPFDTRNVKTMACMFLGCSNLKELDLISFKTDKLECIIEMFNGCSSLVNLNIANFLYKYLNLIAENDEAFLDLPIITLLKESDYKVKEYILKFDERHRPLK